MARAGRGRGRAWWRSVRPLPGSVWRIPREPRPIGRRAARGMETVRRAGAAGPCAVTAVVTTCGASVLLRRRRRRAGRGGARRRRGGVGRRGLAGGLRVGRHVLAARLRVRQGLVLVGLRLLLARRLVLAGHVVALLLGDFVLRLRLGNGDVILGVRRALALGFELGLRDLLVALRFLDANVLGVARHGLALFLRRLVVGFDAVLLGAIVRARRGLGVLDRVGQGAARRLRGIRRRGTQGRRTEQEGPGQGGVKSRHSHL